MASLHTVAAFSSSPFGGNMAGVCLLDGPAPVPWMQALAANLNLSETAFLHRQPDGRSWALRWFTPSREVPLCGHATLASAHVLRGEGLERGAVEFDTASGRLTCTPLPGGAGGFRMDFPADPAGPAEAPPGLWDALGARGTMTGLAPAMGNLLVVVADEAAVRATRPDFRALRNVLGELSCIVTAPAADGDGYVCRYFAPGWGIDEDPATGSIQCTLGPYWAPRLGQAVVRCRQLSARGAEMQVEPRGDRVLVGGQAVGVMRGEVTAAAAPPALRAVLAGA